MAINISIREAIKERPDNMVDNTRVVMRVRLVLVVTRANTRVVIKELLGRLVNNTRVVMRV